MNKKNILFSILMFILLIPTIAFASVNEELKDGYWYLYDESGNMLTGFQYIPQLDKTCYYDRYGHMLYGLQWIDGNVYYFDTGTGGIQKGQQKVNGHWYYFDDTTGIAKIGFVDIPSQDKRVYYNQDGTMLYGLQKIEGNYYYFDYNSGGIQKGQQKVNGHWYYFDDTTGIAKIGFVDIPSQDKRVYYNQDGTMLYGLQKIEGNYYYFDYNSGGIQKGQQKVNGHWYYFDDTTGIARTGFVDIPSQNKRVYYNQDGTMQYGQKKIDGYWYLFDSSSGAMLTGFQIIHDQQKTVYYDENGHMIYGHHTIDGVDYYFNEQTGAMKSNFVYKNGKTYYYFEDGSMANDWVNIAGEKYFFNSLGEMIGKNVQKVVDVSAYQTNIDWYTAKTSGGVDGAILRIAAGCEREDTQLAYNIQEVKKYNIPYGIYIYSYAENYNEGVLYAQFTINTIKKYGMNPSLGIYLDLEKNSATSYMGVSEYTEVVRGYMDTMQAAGYGNLTKIYTYTSYANSALNSLYIRNQIDWIAQYYHYTTYTGPIRMWQYSSTERVAGINGNVDVSVKFY